MTTPLDTVRTRPIGVGPLGFEVESTDPAVITRFDRLFAGFPDPSPSAPRITIEVRRRSHSGGGPDLFDSTVDGVVLAEAMPLGDQEFRITRLFNDRKLDAEPELLHLHAAGVSSGGRAVLLVGRSGSGKSSLAAALVRSGWGYLTDEMVSLSVPDCRVSAYPRPITLREGTWPSFPELAPYPVPPPDSHGGARIEVSPVDLGAVCGGALLGVVAVVVPRYTRDDPAGLLPIPTAAETVELLVSCCYDLERLGAAGAAVLVQLAALGAAWRLDYDGFSDAILRCEEIAAGRDSQPRLDVVHAPPAPTPGAAPSGTLRRSVEAHGWRFSDGSAIVFDPAKLQLGRLDDAGFTAWQLLAEPRTATELASAVGAEDPAARVSLQHWVDVMTQAGFVEVASDDH